MNRTDITRTVWIARIAAVVMLLAFIILMSRLHGRLTELRRDQPAAAVSTDE